MNSIVNIYCIENFKKLKILENHKVKHLVASLGLSLEAFRLQSCIGISLVQKHMSRTQFDILAKHIK